MTITVNGIIISLFLANINRITNTLCFLLGYRTLPYIQRLLEISYIVNYYQWHRLITLIIKV